MKTLPETQIVTPSVLYFGTPVLILSTLNKDGTTNLAPMSSLWTLGQNAVLGVGLHSQSYANLLRESGCVINLPDAALWREVEALAPTTGCSEVPDYKRAMGYRFEADKFACAGFDQADSDLVAPRRIAQCPVQMEAELVGLHETAGGDFAICEMAVRRVHVHSALAAPSGRHIRVEEWHPLFYVFRHYLGGGASMGKNFRAEAVA